MSKDEIKYEINKVLDVLPDQILQEILTILKDIESKSKISFSRRNALNKILSEDRELLEKLAK
jgi:hypothetical protein